MFLGNGTKLPVVGMGYDVAVNPEAREYNGKWYQSMKVEVGDELYFADLDNNKIVASRYNGSGVSWFEAVTAKRLVNMSKAYFSREVCRFNEIKVFSHLEMEQILKSK